MHSGRRKESHPYIRKNLGLSPVTTGHFRSSQLWVKYLLADSLPQGKPLAVTHAIWLSEGPPHLRPPPLLKRIQSVTHFLVTALDITAAFDRVWPLQTMPAAMANADDFTLSQACMEDVTESVNRHSGNIMAWREGWHGNIMFLAWHEATIKSYNDNIKTHPTGGPEMSQGQNTLFSATALRGVLITQQHSRSSLELPLCKTSSLPLYISFSLPNWNTDMWD